MSKKARAAMITFMEHEPENEFITEQQFKEKYTDFPKEYYPLVPNHTFMWNDTIITIKFSHKSNNINTTH